MAPETPNTLTDEQIETTTVEDETIGLASTDDVDDTDDTDDTDGSDSDDTDDSDVDGTDVKDSAA